MLPVATSVRCLTLAAVMLTGVVPAAMAAAEYHTQLFRRGPSLTETVVTSDTENGPPASISGTDQPSDGTNSFKLWSYAAKSDQHAIELHGHAATYSAYVVGATWWETARWRWDDVVFTCADGRSQVDATLRIKVKGSVSGYSYTYQTAPMANVALWLGHPQYFYTQGVWRPASNNSWPDNSCINSPPYTCTPTVPGQPSSGVFAGSTGDAVDQTVNFKMGEPPVPTVPTGTPIVVAPAFTLEFNVLNETVLANFTPGTGGGISLPTDGPVFNLPSGCTCNSQQMGVVNNLLSGPTAATVQTWGKIKALYR